MITENYLLMNLTHFHYSSGDYMAALGRVHALRRGWM